MTGSRPGKERAGCSTKGNQAAGSGTRDEWFTLAACHDLAGPISAIGLANDLIGQLLRQPMTEETMAELEELHEAIARCVTRSDMLISGLLSLAGAGSNESLVSVVDVLEIVESILDENAAAIEERGIEVHLDEYLGELASNPAHIYQVFSNLVGNAIGHNDSANPVIHISYLGIDEDGGRRYLVRDNGSPIPPQDLERVFDPFFKGRERGTGIGLSIVARIVDLHGGWVEAYNADGVCFEFSMKGLDAPGVADRDDTNRTRWWLNFGPRRSFTRSRVPRLATNPTSWDSS